jgi:hypothetical protein
VDAEIQGRHQVAETFVSFRRIVLDNVARDEHALCAPVTGMIVVKYALQSGGRHCATQLAIRAGK